MLPKISFSKWHPWKERAKIVGIELPGVYILAIFRHRLPKVANPLDKSVIYIGETTGQNFRKRWRQFNHSSSPSSIIILL
ncbi:MAG: hypothetical protein ABH863_02635 [Candidatus Micrarchaeota archaeon]